MSRLAPILESSQALKDGVSDLLAPDGPLAKTRRRNGLPFAHHMEQVQLARAYADIISAPDPEPGCGGRIAAIAAETGMGKTTAYLAALTLNAAMLGAKGIAGEKGVISTRTRSLQRQIADPRASMDESRLMAEAVEEMTGTAVSFARRIGRRNYIDAVRARRVADSLQKERPQDADMLRAIADMSDRWRKTDGAATFDELQQDFSLDLPRGLSQDDLCITASSGPKESAAYNADVAESTDSDIVVINHALALVDARIGGGLFAPRQVALFDEADTIPDVARGMADERISLETILLSLNGIPDSDDARPCIAKLQSTACNALQDGALVIDHKNTALIDAARDSSEALKCTAKSITDDRDLRDTMRAAALYLKHWANSAADQKRGVDSVLIPTPTRNHPTFHLRHRSPAFVLSRLWHDREDGEPLYRAVAFTSATLAPFGGLGDSPAEADDRSRFAPFLRAMGVGAGAGEGRRSSVRTCPPLFEPEQFGDMQFMLASRHRAPSARSGDNDPKFPPYIAAAVRKARESGGRILVLATSFELAEQLGAEIRKDVPGLLMHNRGQSLASLLEKYRADEQAVLITPSAWEGVDLPGLVDHLIIPRIPFAPSDVAQIAVMETGGIRARAARGISASANFAAASRKLKQGIGRGIRRADDRCTIWILDSRLPGPQSFAGAFAQMPSHVIPARFSSAFQSAETLEPDGEIRSTPEYHEAF